MNFTKPLLVLGAALAAMMFLAQGCDGGGGGTPTPIQPDGQTPQATGAASQGAGRTGIQEVDAVIDAALSGDPEAYRALVRLTSSPCTREETAETIANPLCRPDEPEGTPVDFLPFIITGTCNVAARTQEVRADELGLPVSSESELYAVYQTVPRRGAGRRYTAVFVQGSADPRWQVLGTRVLIENGRVVSVNHHCGDTRAELVAGVQPEDFVLSPQEQ